MAKTLREVLTVALELQAKHLRHCLAHDRDMVPVQLGVMERLLSHPEAVEPAFEQFRQTLATMARGAPPAPSDIIEFCMRNRWEQARRVVVERIESPTVH